MKDKIRQPKYVYDDETLNILEDRRKKFIKSKTKGFTVEESMKHVKQTLLNNLNNAAPRNIIK